jgi:hypothetical protein
MVAGENKDGRHECSKSTPSHNITKKQHESKSAQ